MSAATGCFFGSPVAIRSFHGKGVGEMAEFVDSAVFKQYFNDVEAQFHWRISQEAQVVQGGSGKAAAPLGVHGGCGTDPVFRRSGFHLNKYQAIMVAKDQINLSPIRAEIGGEEF
jgi:hypothetical protein